LYREILLSGDGSGPRRKKSAAASGSSFVLVSVLSELFLAFMGCDFPQFALSSAGHFMSPWAPARLSFPSMEQTEPNVNSTEGREPVPGIAQIL
jgi:hypothetical protein